MSDEERRKAYEAIDKLEQEVSGLMKHLGAGREFELALVKIEECAMWLRKAVDRG